MGGVYGMANSRDFKEVNGTKPYGPSPNSDDREGTANCKMEGREKCFIKASACNQESQENNSTSMNAQRFMKAGK